MLINQVVKVLLGVILGWHAMAYGNLEEVTFVYSNWPPYTSNIVPDSGFSSKIIKEAFAVEGIKIQEVVVDNWKRVYELVKEGVYDVSAPWGYSEERAQDVFFSDAIIGMSKVTFAYHRAIPFKWKTYQDLKGLTVGYARGYLYEEKFSILAAEEKLFNVEYVIDDVTGIRMLAANRIDVLPISRLIIQYIADNSAHSLMQNIALAPNDLEQLPLYLLFGKKSNKSRYWLHKFNSGMQTLKDKGRLKELYQNFDI